MQRARSVGGVQLVQIENVSQHPVTIVLTHDHACSDEKCFCQPRHLATVDHNPLTGERGERVRKVALADSIQLFAKGRPGSVSKPLPPHIERVPDVARALRAKAIRLLEVKIEPTADLPPELPSTPTEPAPAHAEEPEVWLEAPTPDPEHEHKEPVR